MNKNLNLNLIKQIWSDSMHSDLLQYKQYIQDYLQMLQDTEGEPNTYQRGIKTNYYTQILSNKILNSLTIAYQNNIKYNELYQYSVNENIKEAI